MPTITTKDGTQIYYKDWGTGQPVVFSHGWPLSADAWEDQMIHLASHGYRCIAHDRRGHGRSSQPWEGNEMNTYADDLATLVEELNLKDAIHIGHSTGGGEVARYIGRHGRKRVAMAVLIGAVPPLMLKTASNPGGLPMDVFDQIRALNDRSQFFKDLSIPFYGANRPGSKVSQGLRDSFWLQGMLCGHKAAYDCIKAFSETFEGYKKGIQQGYGLTLRQASLSVIKANIEVYEGFLRDLAARALANWQTMVTRGLMNANDLELPPGAALRVL